jgi:hypothetical protein
VKRNHRRYNKQDRSSAAWSGAAAQQGPIQMVRDFCDHSNAICEACKLPKLVRDWPQRETQEPVIVQCAQLGFVNK